MLDTYKTVNKFKRLYNLVSYFKGYVEFKNFDLVLFFILDSMKLKEYVCV
jgi:hypothetical protein